MAAAIDSISANSFIPSLFHLASIKIAISLSSKFGILTLNKAFAEIQLWHTAYKRNKDNRYSNTNRAKESIFSIPAHLRNSVKKAVNGLHHSVECWQSQHSKFPDIKNAKKIIIWKSDGTINRIETAHKLVLDVNRDIKVRFDIACSYCLEKGIQTLWAEMEDSDRTECLQSSDKYMSRFWAEWLCDGRRVPWFQFIAENLDPRSVSIYPHLRLSTFFPFLKQEDREKFFGSFEGTTLDDMLLCLSVVTKEEKKQILTRSCLSFLVLFLNWPMQRIFLETVEKVMDYVSDTDFLFLLRIILYIKDTRLDFDYCELFDGLWIKMPNDLRESAKQSEILGKKIELYMNNKQRKRKILV